MLVIKRKPTEEIQIKMGEETLNLVVLETSRGQVKLGFLGTKNFVIKRTNNEENSPLSTEENGCKEV